MADFLGVKKIFIQGQECGFAAKWENHKNRAKMKKTFQNKGSLHTYWNVYCYLYDYHIQ